MATIRPFRGLRYNLSVAGEAANLLAPPYDVVDDSKRAALAGRCASTVVAVNTMAAAIAAQIPIVIALMSCLPERSSRYRPIMLVYPSLGRNDGFRPRRSRFGQQIRPRRPPRACGRGFRG